MTAATQASRCRCPPADYRLRLLAASPASTAAGQRVFDVKVINDIAAGVTARSDRVDIFARTGGANRVLELACPVELTASGVAE